MQFNAFFGNRLLRVVVDQNGQVVWGPDFGWWIVIAIPSQPGNFMIRHIGGAELQMPDDIASAGSGEWTIHFNTDFYKATLSRKNYDRKIHQIFKDEGVFVEPPKTRPCPNWLLQLQKESKVNAGSSTSSSALPVGSGPQNLVVNDPGVANNLIPAPNAPVIEEAEEEQDSP
jgi:hypothetical protein